MMIGSIFRSVCCRCKSLRSLHKYGTPSVNLLKMISSTTEHTNTINQFEDREDGEEEFGDLAKKKGVTVFKLPPEVKLPMEKDEEEPVRPRFFSEKQPRWYFHQCKKLAKQRKWRECLEFFEERMLKQDQVFPEESNYSVVIGALGRAGQAKKAFQLYKSMRERALVPSATVYTGLFNSVAQSSNSEDFGRALGLYKKLHRNKIRMNRITYGSLIKVFGRHGTTEQMMGAFRESIIAGFEPDVETFNVILLCLLKHSDTGLREAIQVWRQMVALGIEPNGKSITYLLKIVRECGIGDPNVAFQRLFVERRDPEEYKDFFQKNIRNVYWLKGQTSTPISKSVDKLPPPPEIMSLDPGSTELVDMDDTSCDTILDTSITASDAVDGSVAVNTTDTSLSKMKQSDIPNLLELPFTRHACVPRDVFGIKKISKPNEKLELIGGYTHILDMFVKYDITPTKMVLSSLVWVLPENREAEMAILDFASKHKVQLDTDVYNAILRKCIYRGDFSWLKEVHEMMVSAGLEPNYRTWCIMAMSCKDGYQGVSLIKQLKETAVELDQVFFQSILSAALHNKSTKIQNYDDVKGYDYRYLTRILWEMQEFGIKAENQLIKMLEKASDWPEGYNRWVNADIDFERKVFKFRRRYKEWLGVTEMKDDCQ